jgi:hypothetical protein
VNFFTDILVFLCDLLHNKERIKSWFVHLLSSHLCSTPIQDNSVYLFIYLFIINKRIYMVVFKSIVI